MLYASTLVAVGGLGVYLARPELVRVLSLDFNNMSAEATATLLNQYRFLKGIELAAGIVCLTQRRRIYAELSTATLFLVVVGTGVCARMLSVAMDGMPSALFVTFLLLELLVFGVVGMDLRRRSHG